MVTFFLNYLAKHKLINMLILCSYYLMIVLPHEKVGLAISAIFEPYSRDFYNGVIGVISIVLVVLVCILLSNNIAKHSQKKKLIIYLCIQALLFLSGYYYLMIVNIEMIHFIQYAIFALIAYPLISHYPQLLIFTVFAGAFDEAYQYFYLSPERTNYYDFNDVILNTIGAGTGILILFTLNYFSVWKGGSKWVYISASIIVCLIILAFPLGYLYLYPRDDTNNLFALIREIPESFWSKVGKDIVYHIIRPWVGILITILLILFYSGINYKPIAPK